MRGAETKHLKDFEQSRRLGDETVVAHLEGHMGRLLTSAENLFRAGELIVTDQRVCFHVKGDQRFIGIALGDIVTIAPDKKGMRITTDKGEIYIRTHEQPDYVGDVLAAFASAKQNASKRASEVDGGESGQAESHADRPEVSEKAAVPPRSTKTCPDCAESIKGDARICRFCRFDFAAADLDKAIAKVLNIPREFVFKRGAARNRLSSATIAEMVRLSGRSVDDVKQRLATLGFRGWFGAVLHHAPSPSADTGISRTVYDGPVAAISYDVDPGGDVGSGGGGD